VLDDRAAPAAGALLGLEPLLEEMGQEDDEVALDRLPVLARHRLDLFDQIGQIELVEATSRNSTACCSSQRQKSRS
jgi:hypothetical protein